MIPDRRQYSLSKDQPILQEARRRKKGRTIDRDALEVEFWTKFPLEKFCTYRTLHASLPRGETRLHAQFAA